MDKLTAEDLIILRAIRDEAVCRDSPHVPATLNGVELDRHHMYNLQERGLILLDHSHAPTLTVDAE